MYVKNALNPAGSHLHNHLRFLLDPRDAHGRPRTHPQYDPRTLRVDHAEWQRHMGAPMTHAVQQWWDLKAQYFDTVLLLKTGKFYEMHHMDADVGVQYCDLTYMKGHTAHAGFPERSYGPKAEALVRAGFKVARVEQTETPEQLQQRQQKHKQTKSGHGPSPKVVNREVCSILTLGTRTFCYLDDEAGLLEESSTGNGSGSAVGPLLAIAEIPLESTNTTNEGYVANVAESSPRPTAVSNDENHNNMDEDNGDEKVQPVCEYGITLVDAIRGTVTIGQFADDILRSRMNTLLTAYGPCEVRCCCLSWADCVCRVWVRTEHSPVALFLSCRHVQ